MNHGHDNSGLEPIQNLAIYSNPHSTQQYGVQSVPGKEYKLSSVETPINQGLPAQQAVRRKKTIELRKSTLVALAIIGFLLIAGLVGGLAGGLLSRPKGGNSTSTPSYVLHLYFT